MKIIKLFLLAVCFTACGQNDQGKSVKAETSDNTGLSSGSGTVSFTIDGHPWSNNKSTATQTGHAFLNIASDDNQTEAISIILDHPATGKLNFNSGVSGSYTDATGASYGSSEGTGSITVTKYIAPSGKTNGEVEGTFSGTFNFNPTTKHVITDGKFSMPVKQL